MKPKKYTEFSAEELKFIEKLVSSYPDTLTQINKTEYLKYCAHDGYEDKIAEVWVSKKFRVVVFNREDGSEHIYLHRLEIDPEIKTWRGNISWDELQELKRLCGRGNKLAVEVFPPDKYIVNECNNRHLWIIEDPDKSPYVWAKLKGNLAPVVHVTQSRAADIIDGKIW